MDARGTHRARRWRDERFFVSLFVVSSTSIASSSRRARARILELGAPRKSLRNSLAVTTWRRARGRAGGARARGPGRDATDGIRIDVSRSVRATTRDRRRRETTTGDDDGRAEGDARRADDKIEDGRRTSAERGDGEGGLSVIVYRGGSLCRVASGCFFLSSPSRVCDGHPGVRFGALGRRAGADD